METGRYTLVTDETGVSTLTLTPDPLVPWDRDISQELSRNPGPYTSSHLQQDNGWWVRTLDQIDCITIHHTLSNSPHATASHYIQKGGGRPTLPYTIWITETGEVLLCVEFEYGLWHDHTGHQNTHLSVGLSGHLHLNDPPDVQLQAAVKVCKWVIESSQLPGVTDTSGIKGHIDHIATQCPGWIDTATGEDRWKARFYSMLEDALGP